jgi:hypothetical protein
MRRLPHQGADHDTVDHGFPADGVFLLLHERVLPSRWLISRQRSSSSLSSLWMPSGANDSSLDVGGASGLLGLEILRGQGKRDRTGASGLFGPVRSPLLLCGSLCIYVLCPLHLMLSSHPRWRFSSHEVRPFTLQSPGVFLVALRSLPPLEVISSSS